MDQIFLYLWPQEVPNTEKETIKSQYFFLLLRSNNKLLKVTNWIEFKRYSGGRPKNWYRFPCGSVLIETTVLIYSRVSSRWTATNTFHSNTIPKAHTVRVRQWITTCFCCCSLYLSSTLTWRFSFFCDINFPLNTTLSISICPGALFAQYVYFKRTYQVTYVNKTYISITLLVL